MLHQKVTAESPTGGRAMTDAALMVVMVGVIALALVIDLAALVGWLRRRR